MFNLSGLPKNHFLVLRPCLPTTQHFLWHFKPTRRTTALNLFDIWTFKVCVQKPMAGLNLEAAQFAQE